MHKQAQSRLPAMVGTLIILIIILVFILFQIGLFAEPELTLKQRGPYIYVYTKQAGLFRKITEAQDKAEELISSQKINTAIPCSIYLNGPSSVINEELQWRTGYLVGDSVV